MDGFCIGRMLQRLWARSYAGFPDPTIGSAPTGVVALDEIRENARSDGRGKRKTLPPEC